MKAIIMFLLFLTVVVSGDAQTFKWIKGGGTTTAVFQEKTNFIAASSSGSVYAASMEATTGASGNVFAINLTSYSCAGALKWSTMIRARVACYCYGLKYSNGAIYVSGQFGHDNRYVGSSAITGNDNQEYFLAKLDTFGSLQWIRFPGPLSGHGGAIEYGALDVDGAGSIHHFTFILSNGIQLTPTVVSQRGTYDFVYDASGNLLRVFRLGVSGDYGLRDDYSLIGRNNAVAISKKSGKIYTTMTLNDGFHSHAPRLCAFSPTGALLWEDTTTWSAYPDRSALWNVCYDEKNGIYASGTCGKGRFGIQGFPIVYHSTSVSGTMSVIVKVDTNGSPKWIYANEHVGNIGDLGFTSLLPDGNIIAAGSTSGNVSHGSTTLISSTGGQNPFYTIVDTTGNLVKMDILRGNGTEYFSALTTDHLGNAFFGGQVSDSVKISDSVYYKSVGGPSDFFVTKLGYNCGCTTSVVAAFTNGLPNNKTVTYSYTGTTASVDSLVWTFGDGQKLKVVAGFTTPVSHTYPTNAMYNVCVTAYSSCGNHSFCKLAPLAVNATGSSDNIVVAPNPAREYLHISGAGTTTAVLTNLLGQQLRKIPITGNYQEIFIGDLPSGLYMLTLISEKGIQSRRQVIKQ